MYAAKVISRGRHKLSKWSGGSTTELAIYPPGSGYASRDFDVRVSSAAVETEQSEFTDLPGFIRYIMPLDGNMTLCHEGRGETELSPFDTHRFDGAWKTVSRGTCIDFNLMLRYGWEGGIEALSPGISCRLEPLQMLWVYSLLPLSIANSYDDTVYDLNKGDLLFISENNEPMDISINLGMSNVSVYAVAAKVYKL